MKKICFILSLAVCMAYLTHAQTPTVYTFRYNGTEDPPPCCPDLNNNWKSSHGSPCYAAHPAYNYWSYDNLKLVTSYTNSQRKSEGAFVSYSFSKNNNYRVSFTLKNLDGSPYMEVYGANGLTEKKDTSCGESAPQSITDKELIGIDLAVCSGAGPFPYYCDIIIPSPLSTDSYWNPSKNYSQFWVASSHQGGSGSFIIQQITITDYGKVESDPPKTPGNLRATAIESKKITVAWDISTDNTRVDGYEIYCDNKKSGTTKDTTYTLTDLKPCTSYTIEVRAYDPYDNYSPKAALKVKTRIDLPDDIVLQDPVNLSTMPNKEYIVQAANSITLKTGFSVAARDAKEYFHCKISGCGDSFSSNPLPDNEESFLMEEDISMNPYSETDSLLLTNEEFVYNNPYKQATSEIFDISHSPPSDIHHEVLIYPNPTSNMVTIAYQLFTGREEIIIFDITGKSLFNNRLSGSISNIDVSDFSPGIYFIKIMTQEKIFVKKLVKK